MGKRQHRRDLDDVGHDDRRVMKMGDGWLGADDIAGDLQGVVHRRCWGEAHAAHGLDIAADDNDASGVVHGV